MRLFHVPGAVLVESDGRWFRLPGETWDTVVNRDDLHQWVSSLSSEEAGNGDAFSGVASRCGEDSR